MSKMTRRNFLGITAASLGTIAIGPDWLPAAGESEQHGGIEDLYRKFKDPGRQYSIRPFWFWNGKLEGAELRRQIKQMADHGVYGAYAHNRDGLQTPYLSEAWWQVVGEALKAAREYGFSLCMVDEFEWPSGEARDYWLPGINKSRVVAANPDFHMRRLACHETRVHGPQAVRIPLPPEPVAVVVARETARGMLDGNSLQALPLPGNHELEWNAPQGNWIIFTYATELAIGQPDHGHVDLMSREAVAKYIEIYYEEFYRRYGEFFGNAMPATFADHEGDYGAKLPWTPRLFETFRRRTGYALEPFLPALTYDIGKKTEKVRCDLLDTASELYCDSFFGQVTRWSKQHNIEHSGHVWEESLFFGPAEQGDFFRILRSLSNPGCDTLVEWGRQSVWLKEVASVADFEGRHVVCENQGVQGEDSYLSPERMRRVSNCLGAWNIGEFIPHAFDYDLSRINFPPDWFRSQPYLPWFRAYTDQMRRISFMNRESHHVADLLVLYPQVSIWGQSAPAFRIEKMSRILNNESWSDDAVETNSNYAELKLRLTNERLDFKVADDDYLAKSRLEAGWLRIGESRFHTLILPPMSTTRAATAGCIRNLYRAGGTVIALRRLPSISVEAGRGDETLRAAWEEIFDTRPAGARFRFKQNAAGGRSYFVEHCVEDVLEALRHAAVDRDIEVPGGPTDHLFVLHKVKDGIHFYWVVNDTAEPRTNVLALNATGRPERWDADSAKRSPLFYQTSGNRTLVRLSLGPWDAAYIVFDPSGPAQPFALESTNADDLYVVRAGAAGATVRAKSLLKGEPLHVALGSGSDTFRGEYKPANVKSVEITGDWKITVEAPSITLPYALVIDDPGDRGLRERWYRAPERRLNWSPLWLSPAAGAIREWNVIGPFPNPQDRGLDEHYPPERETDYLAAYAGDDSRDVQWQRLDTTATLAAPAPGAWALGTVVIEGGPYANGNFVADYSRLLRVSPLNGTVYAQTNVYSLRDSDALMMLATPNPQAVFLNGTLVYSRWLRPLYNQLTDGFAARVPLHLRAGWNNLLLKFLHNPENPQAGHFYCRIATPDGFPMPSVFSAGRKFQNAESGTTGYRWLKFPIPAVAGGLRVPPLRNPWLAFVDGKRAEPASELELVPGCRSVVLRVAAGEAMAIPFAFSTRPASAPLGTWKTPGLENFSGSMVYERTVEVPSGLLSEKLLLDCGAIGVVAEAWVNGNSLGSRAWAPYAFDVTGQVRPGINQIKVRVANTAANSRAVGTSRGILGNIDLDGWHGPARLIPYADREIVCRPVARS